LPNGRRRWTSGAFSKFSMATSRVIWLKFDQADTAGYRDLLRYVDRDKRATVSTRRSASRETGVRTGATR
jgi:hypothetical protein